MKTWIQETCYTPLRFLWEKSPWFYLWIVFSWGIKSKIEIGYWWQEFDHLKNTDLNFFNYVYFVVEIFSLNFGHFAQRK